jgi:predicted transcriptional regulator of viral defense system
MFGERRCVMTNSEKILEILRKNNGVITTAEVTESAISRGSLKHLVDTGIIERASRGVYQFANVWDDEMYHLQVRYKKGIFSGETALYLHDLTDRTPIRYQLTFPNSYNLTNVKNQNIKCNRVIKKLYDMGVVEIKTPAGNFVRAYNIERTLCDILRTQSDTDIQIVSDAFKRYMKRNDKNIPLLSVYSKKLRVEAKIRSYMEVLL